MMQPLANENLFPPRLFQSVVGTTDMDLAAFTIKTPGRNNVENFIRDGYERVYAARINVTMPIILAIEQRGFKAALGIRSARECLFVEQYLERPIEAIIIQNGHKVDRNKIVEIGHLYSNAKRFTIPLFMVTAVSLYSLGFQTMTFAGTKHVLQLIKKSGINYKVLANAKQSNLLPSTDSWGSYYSTNPQVVVVSLESVLQVIDSVPKYSALFRAMQEKVDKIHQNLAVLSS